MPSSGDSTSARRAEIPPWSSGRGPSARARLLFPVLICLAVQVPSVVVGRHFRGFAPEDTPGLLLGLQLAINTVGPLVLLAARRFPGPVVAVVAALAVADLVLDGPVGGPPFIALGFAIVGAVVRGARLWAWISVAVAWLLCLTLAGLVDVSWPAYRVATTTLGILVVLGIAESVRSRRDRFAAARQAAGEKRQSELQAERVRIARELHDVLAHSLSQINVQASVGLHLAESQPDKARDALASIKESSKLALDEVRSVLGMLRADSSADAAAPLVPEPDLSRLPALVESVRAQGVRVTLSELPQHVPPAVQLALYRIVQESLTNVVRHTAASEVVVDVHSTGGGSADGDNTEGFYTVTVTDNGTGDGWPAPEGRGLLGMRERAELLGGTFSAAPSAEGGFTVTVRIPRSPHRSIPHTDAPSRNATNTSPHRSIASSEQHTEDESP
jgi:signal transduction histidine kinase